MCEVLKVAEGDVKMFTFTLLLALCSPGLSLQEIAVENVTTRIELNRVETLYSSLRVDYERLEGKYEDLVGDYADLKADYDHLLASKQAR